MQTTRVMLCSGYSQKGFYRSCPGVFEKGVQQSAQGEFRERALAGLSERFNFLF
jgi:hypothetical protein